MLRIIEEPKEEKPRIIEMKDMKPLQVGRIVDGEPYYGCLVMRTACSVKSEVINLTNPRENRCWKGPRDLKVGLLPPGESITIELFNEE